MNDRNVRIEGNLVILEEVCPKHFVKIIEWRNNPEFNQFLNQPYTLTMELQQKWYEKYLTDHTQGLFVVIDKKSSQPFATIGYTDYDKDEKVLISGRLLVGNLKFRGSREWAEAVKQTFNYFHHTLGVNVIYSHVVKKNIPSKRWHEKWGFIQNTTEIKYPHELIVNGMEQDEYFKPLC